MSRRRRLSALHHLAGLFTASGPGSGRTRQRRARAFDANGYGLFNVVGNVW
ncbi:hypothetical protein [Boseongicola aestuarii]|uniref:hypothetical protein n=1 Tax=Boseongicola aestuarii TaxID=1470561 RepID=UPI0015950130|nr:hypothetical protein [Boseongicola aestuarii]